MPGHRTQCNVSLISAKNTLLVEDGCWTGKGSFLFSAFDRLKVGVGEGGDEFLVRAAGVLITNGDDLGARFGEGGGVAASPGLR